MGIFTKRSTNLLALIFIASCSVPSWSEEPSLGRCYMGSCSWAMTTSKQIVEKKKGRVLFRLELVGGTSEHSESQEYPQSYSPNLGISWNSNSHTIFVLCDVKRPLVMMDDQVDLLDLHMVPGVLETAANLWVKTCYDAAPAAWASKDWLKKARIPQLDSTELSESEQRDALAWIQQYK